MGHIRMRRSDRILVILMLGVMALAAVPAGAAGLMQSPFWISQGNGENLRHGWQARTAGDVNGDGYDDLIV